MTEIFTLDYKSVFASRYKLHVAGIKGGGGGIRSVGQPNPYSLTQYKIKSFIWRRHCMAENKIIIPTTITREDS